MGGSSSRFHPPTALAMGFNVSILRQLDLILRKGWGLGLIFFLRATMAYFEEHFVKMRGAEFEGRKRLRSFPNLKRTGMDATSRAATITE